MMQRSSAASSNTWVCGRRASLDRISARHLQPERRSTDQNRRFVNAITIRSPTARELLHEDSPGINQGARELALLRRLELIAQQFQFTTKLAPIAARKGCAG